MLPIKASRTALSRLPRTKGYDVLILDGVLDNHFINTLEQKLEKIHIKRVDSDTADKLIEKDQKSKVY